MNEIFYFAPTRCSIRSLKLNITTDVNIEYLWRFF